MNRNTTVSVLLAGLIAASGAAYAQSTAAGGTSSVPPKAGEASTQLNGTPNAQVNSAAGVGVTTGATVSKDQIRQDAQGQSKASVTSSVPAKAGEASTTVKGNPNMDPNSPMLTKSKAERKIEKEMKKAERDQARQTAIMGQKGAQAGAKAGTPAVSPAGTPAVQDGGTPK